MAVNGLKSTRRRGASLGVRVDDAVAAKRRRGALRVVEPSTGPAPTVERPFAAIPPVRYVAPPTRCESAHAAAPAAAARPAPVVGPAPAPTPVADPGVTRQSDPMFDRDVEEARRLVTSERLRGSDNAAPVRTAQWAPATQAQRAGYRLTLRGQRVLVTAGFALSIMAGAIVGGIIGPEPLPEQTATMVVQSGDSLWTIASVLVEPGEDVRPVVEQIAELNDLHSPFIAAGQTLRVPAH